MSLFDDELRGFDNVEVNLPRSKTSSISRLSRIMGLPGRLTCGRRPLSGSGSTEESIAGKVELGSEGFEICSFMSGRPTSAARARCEPYRINSLYLGSLLLFGELKGRKILGKIGGILERYAVGWGFRCVCWYSTSVLCLFRVVTIVHLEPRETFTCIRRNRKALKKGVRADLQAYFTDIAARSTRYTACCFMKFSSK